MYLLRLVATMPTPSIADLNEDLLVSSYAHFLETSDVEDGQFDAEETDPLPRLREEVARPMELRTSLY